MVKTNSIKAWVLAARPKTLAAALVPVLIAIGFALRDCILLAKMNENTSFHILVVPTLLCVLFAWVMQIDSNFINDYLTLRGAMMTRQDSDLKELVLKGGLRREP